jgi:predicted phage terminase large subunit-like protein
VNVAELFGLCKAYDDFFETLTPLEVVNSEYDRTWKLAEEGGYLKEYIREMVRADRFFLLTRVLKRKDANNKWVYRQCRMVESSRSGWLDLWAREHYKTTIITYAGSIQAICQNPEVTIGIFSFNRPIAKAFMFMIMQELESNELLKWAFDDIFYAKPKSQSARWSLDNGLQVKRKSNPNEQTIEAWGMIDAQPTSKHFVIRIYNDVVTQEAVDTDGAIAKVTQRWRLSQNLGRKGGEQWYEGTLFHHEETYKVIAETGVVRPRVFPATDDQTETGNPLFLSQEELDDKRKLMGPFVFAAQMLLNPTASMTHNFDVSWLRHYDEVDAWCMNRYMIFDPSKGKDKNSDYTAGVVIGLAPDKNYYILDMVRDRLSLTQRAILLFNWHQKWKPLGVGYEQYGMQSDIEHFQDRMNREKYRFHIHEMKGNMKKESRIERLVPMFENSRIWLPKKLVKRQFNYEQVDIVNAFIQEEYRPWPMGGHDDMLDVLARIFDMPMAFPDKPASLVHFKTQIENPDARGWDVRNTGGIEGWTHR